MNGGLQERVRGGLSGEGISQGYDNTMSDPQRPKRPQSDMLLPGGEPMKKKMRMLPVLAHSAEHLVIGQLMRRNILTYRAPPQNEGYDLICIHPDPRKTGKHVRVQVKSRYQTDCDRAIPVKEKTFDAADYLVVVFLNTGYFYRARAMGDGAADIEYYTLPMKVVRRHHKTVKSGFDKVDTKRIRGLHRYKNEPGFEQIARDLKVARPLG